MFDRTKTMTEKHLVTTLAAVRAFPSAVGSASVRPPTRTAPLCGGGPVNSRTSPACGPCRPSRTLAEKPHRIRLPLRNLERIPSSRDAVTGLPVRHAHSHVCEQTHH
jgi:hypothetical protein